MANRCFYPIFLPVVLAAALFSACGPGDVGGQADTQSPPGDGGADAAVDGSSGADQDGDGGYGLADVEPVRVVIKKGCNPLATSTVCTLPYPSHWYEVSNSASATGVRLNYPDSAIPTGDESSLLRMDPTNRADGVSPAGPVILHFGADVDPARLIGQHDIVRSLESDSPVAIFDLVTGKRVPFMSEMDRNIKPGYDGRYAFIIRPLAPMAMGHRHAVAVTTDLAGADGKPFSSPRAFAALRDRVPTTSKAVEAERGRYESLFTFLGERGYSRDNLLIAWDFSVASDDYLLGSVLSMREKTLKRAGGAGLEYTITRVVDDPNTNIARLVSGTFTVPTFIREDNTIEYDEYHHPIEQAQDRSFPFTMLVPQKARTRTGPLPLVIFGHGIFGTGKEYLEEWAASITQPMAEEAGVVVVATDWIGLSGGDRDIILKDVLGDLNKIGIVTDRLQQSLVNNLTLTELALGKLAVDPRINVGDGPLVSPAEVWYFGVSLGGIQGGSFTALSPRITRAVLSVPGSVWLNMIPRSSVWVPIKTMFDLWYHDPLAQQVAIGFFQTWFDHSDPINLTKLLFEKPLPDVPVKSVLVQESIGDCLVPNLTTEMLARSVGIPLMIPSITQVYGVSEVAGPYKGTVMVQYRLPRFNNPLPPETNVPPSSDNGVHSDIFYLDNVLDQVVHFLETGETVQYCDGACDPD